MQIKPAIGLDFETNEIEDRPVYPPIPVGVSIMWPGERKSKYWAWGHPTRNNCTKVEAQKELQRVWKSTHPIVCHHAKFDMEVAHVHMGMPLLSWERMEDTMFLLFLDDPHAMSLGLKPSAQRVLGMSPDERDSVREWLVQHGVCKPNDSKWGRHIAQAPGDIVGKYADGDVIRTVKLRDKLLPKIIAAGMQEAYNRERRLMPIFMESERQGLRVDLKALERDIVVYDKAMESVESWLRKKLQYVGSALNFDSDAEVAEALELNDAITDWTLTKTGKRSVSKKNLTIDKFKDKRIFYALGYRNRLRTCSSMFMRPWLEKASANKGYIHPNWNQVRQPRGNETKGTRTGRPSCDEPNLLNVSKSFYDRGDFYEHPKFIKGLPELPLIRRYALPDNGHVWCHRDYNQQELRILAHFEDGAILQAYRDNPDLDVHSFVQSEIKRLMHRDIDRGSVKTMNFGKLYGQGLGALAEKLNTTVEEVKSIRDSQNKALPGLKEVEDGIKQLARAGEPIVTWGGRHYHVEPPKYSEKFGREMTFEYKLINYLVQGSAADVTKEAVIRYHDAAKDSRFLVTVYDEINISAPKAAVKKEMRILKDCMEGIELDVFMKSDGKTGKNWADLTKYKE